MFVERTGQCLSECTADFVCARRKIKLNWMGTDYLRSVLLKQEKIGWE